MPGSEKRRSRTVTFSAAGCSSAATCRSVASSAASGMLLRRPTSMVPGDGGRQGFDPLSIRTGMISPRKPIRIRLFCRDHPADARMRRIERLIEAGDDVVDMLDADAKPDHIGPSARLALLLGRHLPIRRGGGLAGTRLSAAPS